MAARLPERFFGRYRLSEISPRVVDRFRDELHEQAEAIRTATARGRVLKETVTDKRGRTYERKRRALSNTSINAMITLLGQIMQQALTTSWSTATLFGSAVARPGS